MAALTRVARLLLGVVLAIVVLVLIAAVAIQTPWVRDWLRDLAERQAARATGADVAIGRLGGNLLTGVDLRNVRLAYEGRPIATIPQAEVDYSLIDLVTGAVDVRNVTLEQPVIHLRRTSGGLLNVAALGPSTPRAAPDQRGPGRGWAIDALVIRQGTVTIGEQVVTAEAVNAPERLVNLDATLAIGSRSGGGVRITINALSFQAREPELRVRQAEGVLVIAPALLRFDSLSVQTGAGSIAIDGAIRNRQTTPRYDVDIRTEQLQLRELASALRPLEGYAVSPTLDVALRGPANALEARFEADSEAGAVSGNVTLDLSGPERAARGTIRTQNLDLAGVRPSALEESDLTLESTFDLKVPAEGVDALSGTYEVSAPEFAYGSYQARDVQASGRIDGRRIGVNAEARVYGGTARTTGSITLPANDEPVAYDLRGRVRDIDPAELPPHLRFPGVSRSMTSGPGIDMDFDVRGRGGDVEARGRLLDLSLAGATFTDDTIVSVSRKGGRLQYSAEGTVHGLDPRRLGRELGIDALTDDRYAGEITARFDVTGAGTALESLTLNGTVTLVHSELFGGRIPQLRIEPQLERGAGTIALTGRFEAVDIAAVTGNASLESQLNGTIDVRTEVEDLASPDFTPGAMEAGGRVTLSDSSLAGIPIDDMVLDATVTPASARIRQLTIAGPDLDVEVAGDLVLDRTGQSALTYVVDTPRLERFERFGIPVRGDVLLKGRVGGNVSRFQVHGTVSGTHVGYGETTALAIHGEYDATIPDVTPSAAGVQARMELTELEAAGRSFASIAARIAYADRRLDFGTVLEDAGRTVRTDGRLLWHVDRQALHLRRFDFETPDATWSLATSREAVVQYGGDGIAIESLALVSDGGGRIAIEGELGSPDSMLTASIESLALDHIDDLVLDEPLSGTLTATARIRGTFNEPRVDATVEIANGAYRGFEYQRAAGTIDYTPALVRLDLRLDQTEGVALTANGVVPLSEAAGEAMRVKVHSTPIDLGLVQAFTDEVSRVDGTIEVDVVVAGSLSQPQLEGSMAVRNGAFTVALAQSHYTGLDTTITFERDVLTIREFVLTDDEDHRLRIGGQLALDGARVGDVNLTIESDAFEVADNRLGELNVDLDVRVTGELLRPRIEGTIGVTGGQVRIDRVLQVLREPYEPSTPRDESTDAEAGAFAPAVSLNVNVPDTLVIRGTNLRAPGGGGPIGLGDVNITIGGDLEIRKQPGEDLVLAGDVQTVRGTYEFQGRQFQIQPDGRVVFMGTPEINPRLDISAQREISGVVATVHIGGVLDAPELELSSQPPMGDAEILSLIVFNQPLSLLGTGQQISLAARATALASGFVASRLAESIGDALELDMLEIETAGDVAGGLAPMVTVGEQFGQLFVKLRQRFGPEAVSEAIVEYRLADWLRIQTAYAESDAPAGQLLRRVEAGGIDLLFFFSY